MQNFQRIEDANNYDPRNQVFTKDKLNLLVENVTPLAQIAISQRFLFIKEGATSVGNYL